MGRQQIVSFTWTCDVCGNEIPESDADGASRKISWDGSDYQVDLCAAHQGQLADALTKLKVFVDAGQRSTGGRGRRAAGGAATSGSAAATGHGDSRVASTSSARSRRRDLGSIRSWARDNGHTVSERGRIAGSVLSAYDEANRSDTPAAASAPGRRRPRKAVAAS